MATQADTNVRVLELPPRLRNLAELAVVLERVEQSAQTPDPRQYRLLVKRVTGELQSSAGLEGLDGLLACFPAAAELYENLQYAHAGLVRQPLESSAQSEATVRTLLLELAQRRAPGGTSV